MEQVITDWMTNHPGLFSATIGVPMLALIFLMKDPLSAWLKHRELNQKDKELLLNMLKEGHFSPALKQVVIERLEHDELFRATGVPLPSWKRDAVIEFVRKHAASIEWKDIKHTHPDLSVSPDALVYLKKPWWTAKPFRWTAKTLHTFFALTALLTFLIAFYLSIQGQHWRQFGFWFAYSVIYFFLSLFTQVNWLSVLNSYEKLHSCLSPTGQGRL